MSISSADIAVARAQAKVQATAFCNALDLVLPVLEQIRKNARGWKFWLRWGMDSLISAIQEYRKNVCPRNV
jgi:hypothetical protein